MPDVKLRESEAIDLAARAGHEAVRRYRVYQGVSDPPFEFLVASEQEELRRHAQDVMKTGKGVSAEPPETSRIRIGVYRAIWAAIGQPFRCSWLNS